MTTAQPDLAPLLLRAATLAIAVGGVLPAFVETAERVVAADPADLEAAVGLRIARAYLVFQRECEGAVEDSQRLILRDLFSEGARA